MTGGVQCLWVMNYYYGTEVWIRDLEREKGKNSARYRDLLTKSSDIAWESKTSFREEDAVVLTIYHRQAKRV